MMIMMIYDDVDYDHEGDDSGDNGNEKSSDVGNGVVMKEMM